MRLIRINKMSFISLLELNLLNIYDVSINSPVLLAFSHCNAIWEKFFIAYITILRCRTQVSWNKCQM